VASRQTAKETGWLFHRRRCSARFREPVGRTAPKTHVADAAMKAAWVGDAQRQRAH
jgi:hypothetical protein